MKRISTVLLTSLLALGAYAAQAADAPAASTSVQTEKNHVKAEQQNVRKQDKVIREDKQDIAKDKHERSADTAQLKKDEKAGNTAAVAQDKKDIDQENKAINKHDQQTNVAHQHIAGDKAKANHDRKEIKNDHAAAAATASTAPAASTH